MISVMLGLCAILLLVLGVLALIFPMIASAWVTVVVALAFLVGGLIGWVNSLNRSRQLSKWHCFWRLVVSTLFVVTGAWIIQQFSAGVEPAAAQVAALAFAIGIVFGVLYAASGSIWVPIALHMLVDIIQGAMLLEFAKRPTTSPGEAATPGPA